MVPVFLAMIWAAAGDHLVSTMLLAIGLGMLAAYAATEVWAYSIAGENEELHRSVNILMDHIAKLEQMEDDQKIVVLR